MTQMLTSIERKSRGMNIFVREIAKRKLPTEPDLSSSKLVIEDNIGESIHVHVRNTRLEFSVEDYLKFAECVEEADRRFRDGDR